MTDYIKVEDLVVDESTGEIVEGMLTPDRFAAVARERHYLKEMEEAYKVRRGVLDAFIRRNMPENKVSAGDLVVAIRSGTYYEFDGEKFAKGVADALPDNPEDAIEALLELVAASKTYSEPDFPGFARDAFKEARTARAKRPWVETQLALKPVPKFERVERPDD